VSTQTDHTPQIWSFLKYIYNMWYYSHEETNKRQDHVCLLALCPLKVGHAFPSPWATAFQVGMGQLVNVF